MGSPPRHGRRLSRRLISISALVLIGMGVSTSAVADISADLRNNAQVFGQFDPADEIETYSVFIPEGAAFSVSVKGKKLKGGKTPASTFRVTDADENVVATPTVRGAGAVLKKWIVPASATYRIEVRGDGVNAGLYQLKLKWKTPKKRADSGDVPAGGTREVPFAADRGAVASFLTKRGKGAATLPRLLRVLGPDGEVVREFGPGESPTATSHKVPNIRLDATGDYRFVVEDLTGNGGAAASSVKVKAPKLPKAKIVLTDEALGLTQFLAKEGLQAAVIGPEGGTFIADDEGVGSVIGSGINVPPGGLPVPTAVVIGEGTSVPSPDPDLEARSEATFFGPDGLAFSGDATVSVPLDLVGLGGSADSITIVQQESDGTTSVIDTGSYTFDDTDGTVSFPVSHFTSFQVFGNQPAPIESRVTADTPDPLDEFGYSAAMDGEVGVIGAPGEDTSGADAGAVYGFERNGEFWGKTHRIDAEPPVVGGEFGTDLAIDGNRLVVTDLTSVYVFEFDGTSWVQQARMFALDGAGPSERFGEPVDVSGDTIVVGAHLHDAGILDGGGVYVFTRDGDGNWDQSQFILPTVPSSGDLFGIDIALDGDRLMVAAAGLDTFAINGGGIIEFNLVGDAFVEGQAFAFPGIGPERYLGSLRAMAFQGDTLAVGSTTNADRSGEVHVFDRSSGLWEHDSVLIPQDAAPGALFGSAVALDGPRMVVSARNESQAATRAGAGYEFERDQAGEWIETWKLIATDARGEDQFGFNSGFSELGFVLTYTQREGGGAYFFQLPPVDALEEFKPDAE